jgi:hypothetical protein
MPRIESNKGSYQALVAAFYQATICPREDADIYLKEAEKLASSLDEGTIEDAKKEASVLVAEDSQFQA